MKELSIEQKAKRYDEALKVAKRNYETIIQMDNDCTFAKEGIVNTFHHMFPELKESEGNEDERIMKAISDILLIDNDEIREILDANNVLMQDIDAWLEKQSQTFTKKDVDDAYLKGVCDTKQELEKQGEQKPYGQRQECTDCQFNYAGECKGSCAMKRSEQKPANNVEPKFKVGDWIIHHGTENIYQVAAVIDNQYQLKYGDNYTVQKCADVDRCARLWDITKDAKDGDVLFIGIDGSTCIFKKLEGNLLYSYIISDGKLLVEDSHYYYETSDNVYPATKEQRDQLEKTITDAGYTFDFEKKELKKIDQKSAEWSEEDKKMFVNIKACLRSAIKDYSTELNWLKSIKPQPKQEWSKEDETNASYICASLDCYYRLREDRNNTNGQEDLDKARNWLYNRLKYLKDRVQPKQEWSEEDEYYRNIILYILNNECVGKTDKENAINWLKSLKSHNEC